MKSLVPWLCAALVAACGADAGRDKKAPEASPKEKKEAVTAPASALSSAPVAAPKSAPVAPTSEQVIYDGRRPDRGAAPEISNEPKLSPEEQKKILSALLPDGFTASQEQCKKGDPKATYETIRAQARGSFTKAGANEVIYLVESTFCEPDQAESSHMHYLALFSDGALVTKFLGDVMGETYQEFFGTRIAAVVDVGTDGIQEVLALTGGAGQGAYNEIARLYTLQDAHIGTMRVFDEVYTDECGSGEPDSTITARVISLTPGARPRFRSEDYKAPCGAEPPVFTKVAGPASAGAPEKP
jgi:hypothetical protein